MKERPIIFSAEMIRALLAGTKTQTRRAVKPQPDITGMHTHDGQGRSWGPKDVEYRGYGPEHYLSIPGACVGPMRCPYGTLGDHLWVRETWTNQARVEDAPERRVIYRADNEPDLYRVDGEGVAVLDARGKFASPWISPRFMPRWASRITLEVTGIRAERLQEISVADVRAEGCVIPPSDCFSDVNTGSKLRAQYVKLWESINGQGSWEANPWVWCISFRRVA